MPIVWKINVFRFLYLVCISLSLVLLGVVSEAQAQQITLVGNFPLRDGTKRVFLINGDSDTNANAGINRTDCDNDTQKIRFAFSLPNVSFATLRLYGKSDSSSCAPTSTRTGATGTTPTCHLIASFAVNQVINRQEVGIEPAQIVAAMLGAKDITGPGSYNKKTDCYTTQSMGPTDVYVHALLFDASNQPIGGGLDGTASSGATNQYENTSIRTRYDVNGPQPPTGVTVGAGETILIAQWAGSNNSSSTGDGGTSTSGGTLSNLEPDFQSFRAYCFGGQSTDSQEDASVDVGNDANSDAGDDALADTTSPTPPPAPTGDCPSNIPADFIQGKAPSRALESFACASSGTVSGRLKIENLVNGQKYAVAIAAVDRYGNSGPFSNVVCSTPRPVNDFYKNYINAGGQAGGGYCSFGRAPMSWFTIALITATALFFITRKRKR